MWRKVHSSTGMRKPTRTEVCARAFHHFILSKLTSMNLLKSISILSSTSSGNLPTAKPTPTPTIKQLSRMPSIRTASLCVKCSKRTHEQSTSPQVRRCQPDACDICSKEVPSSALRWIYDDNNKKSIISRSKSSFQLLLLIFIIISDCILPLL